MLDPQLQSLLRSLRRRIRRYVVLDSLLAILVIVLVAFWIGLLIDYVPVKLGGSEMPRSARSLLLLAVGVAVLLVTVRMLLSRLGRPLPDESLALLVERHYPRLQGRLVTAVELLRPGRRNEDHSRELLLRVHREASESIDQVDPARVFRAAPLIRKSAIVVPLLLLLLGFGLANPDALARAASRLTLFSDARWPRRARLEMVGVDLPVVTASAKTEAELQRKEFHDGRVRLPVGSSGTLRIRAAADDAEVPSVCTVYYRTDDGTRGQSNMRRVGRQRDGYQSFVLDGPPISNLAESLTFSVQGLDDRLEDFRIEAIDPPALTDMNVKVRYPGYLSETAVGGEAVAFDLETDYQAGLRIREGSDVVLEAESSLPLANVDAVIETEGSERLVEKLSFSADRTKVRFSLSDFRSPTSIRLVPGAGEGITAQAPFRYFLGAVLDEPPSVSLSLSGIQSAVTPIARLPLRCEAEDDYGVTSLKAFLATNNTEAKGRPQAGDQAQNGDGAAQAADAGTGKDQAAEAQRDADAAGAQPLAVALQMNRDGAAEAVLDLRELTNGERIAPLQPGNSISVYAEARDGYNLAGVHQVSSEIFRLQVVTPEELLALLERRELGLRTRLEQTVTETQGLREQLERFRADGFELTGQGDGQAAADAETTARPAAGPPIAAADSGAERTRGGQLTAMQSSAKQPAASSRANRPSAERQLQILRLRVQQAGLQASKTTEELSGIAESLDDLLEEMVNNRIDSKDRQERLGNGVRDPLRRVVDGSMQRLQQQLRMVEQGIGQPELARRRTEAAIQTTEEVLLELSAVLEKMLDLESYNELLDLVRGLIEDQEKLKEDTQRERKNRVKDLFK